MLLANHEDRVLGEFFKANPHWIHELLKAKDAGGNTIFHLAIKHKKFAVYLC